MGTSGARFLTPLCVFTSLGASLLTAGCADHSAEPSLDSAAPEVRLVQPADGDTVDARVLLVAEVELGEPVWRVVFFADDAPVVIATTTPWEAEWIPADVQSPRSYRVHVEAMGATTRVQSKPATVWVRAGNGRQIWIELPGESSWVERAPDAFARVRPCEAALPEWADSSLASWTFVWSGPDLARPFHSPVLPLEMLPERETRLSVEARPPDGRSFDTARVVRTFRYPEQDEPAAHALELSYAISARDLERVGAALHPSFVFAPCTGPDDGPLEPMDASAFVPFLTRTLSSTRLLDAQFTWNAELVYRWPAEGAEWALVRASGWRWRLATTASEAESCVEEGNGTVRESSGGGASLLWTREPGAAWRLVRWSEHLAPGAYSLTSWIEAVS